MKQNRLQNQARIGKDDFLKMSVSPTPGAHFEGFEILKSIKKSIENLSENLSHFVSQKYLQIIENEHQNASKIHPKTTHKK